MALRFQCPGASFALAGTTFAHGLGAAPDEWAFFLYGAQAGVQTLYRVSAPTSTNFVAAASGAAASGDCFVSIQHSITSPP